MFCAFRDALLYTLVTTSGNLCLCWFLISLKQSGHYALISGINEAFFLSEPLLTGYFFFFWTFSINPKDECEGGNFWRVAYQGIATIPRSNSFKFPFFLISGIRMGKNFTCLDYLSFCHVIGLLDICVWKQLNSCKDEVAGEYKYIYWCWILSWYIYSLFFGDLYHQFL